MGEVAAPGSLQGQLGVAGGDVVPDQQPGEIDLLVFLGELDDTIHLAQHFFAVGRRWDAELQVLVDLHAKVASCPHVAQPLQRRLAPRRKRVAPVIRAEQEHWPCAEPQVVIAEVQVEAFGHRLIAPDEEGALDAIYLLFTLPQMPHEVIEIGTKGAWSPFLGNRLRLAHGNRYRGSQLSARFALRLGVQFTRFAFVDAHREPHISSFAFRR